MKLRQTLVLFAFALAVECFANIFNIFAVQMISKPALMFILIVYFHQNSKDLSSLKNLIIAALLFSWFGDVLLLFDKQFSPLFIFGLVSFLIAHILYVVYFIQIRGLNLLKGKTNILISLIVTAYSGIFYAVLFPHLGDMTVPVLIYCLAISGMVIASFRAFDIANQTFGKICVAGTILFAISDSVLAYNRFVDPIQFGGAIVIFLYAIGQLLITEGALRNLRKLKLE